MKRTTIGIGLALALTIAAPLAHAETPVKNWTAPSVKIYAQKLSDDTMAAHPELLSVTFHGLAPSSTDHYTMFAGSYPERIGNPDDPDDIDVSKKGITIIDPRWHRTKDTVPKFVVLMPLRDASAQNIGLIVYAFKLNGYPKMSETQYFDAATKLRDALASKITSYDALYQPAG